MMCMGYALAYDWCYHAWSENRRETVRAILQRAADAWESFRHANVESPHKGSNWVAVTRGGELVMHLALRGDGDYGWRDERIALCLGDLRQHIRTAYGRSGWTQEGPGYLEYAFTFLAPAVYAAQATGVGDLLGLFSSISWHRLLIHTRSLRPGRQILQSGVAGSVLNDEGGASLLFPVVPKAELPYYLHWYDRCLGIKAARPSFDRYRAGTVWALLYYPTDLPDAGFETHRPMGLVDTEKGVYLFRNRVQDKDDVLVSLVSRNDHHSHAWSQPETMQFGLMAHDTTFAAGPGKEREPDRYSKLLVDGHPKEHPGRAFTRRAECDPDGGGYVRVDASRSFGLRRADRHFLVDFRPSGSLSARLVCVDELADEREHIYTWQLRPEEGVSITVDPSARSFTLRKREAFLQGWLISPRNATLEGDRLLRIHVPAKQCSLVLVMAVGKGQAVHAPSLASVERAARNGWDELALRRLSDTLVKEDE